MLKGPKFIRPAFQLSPQRARLKTPLQSRPSSQTPTIWRKFTPIVNKSFVCYKEKTKHSRASSYDKVRDLSGKIKPKPVKSLKNSGKDLVCARDAQCVDSAKAEMTAGNYGKAVDLLDQAIQSDNTNLEALYSRGVCFMYMQNHEMAVKDFLVVMEVDPGFDKELYLALCMCFSYLGKAPQGLKVLNKGLRRFSSFTKGFLMRGQIYNKAKKFEKALLDFNKVLSLDKNNSGVIVHIAEACIGLKDFDSAAKAINFGINRPELAQKSYFLKIKLEFDLKKYESCMKTIVKFCKAWPNETSVFYYKGLVLLSQSKYTDAVLCFEQVIQGNNDPELVSKSFLNIGKVEIKERNFYGALHTFERSLETGRTKELKSFQKYTEGVVCLMKRKLEEGIKIFSEIITENEPVLKEHIGDCLEYRGFAYFSLKNYKSALNDFKATIPVKVLEKATEFNAIVSEALLSEAENNLLSAINLLKKCKHLFPRNIMPGLCRASILLKLSRSHNNDISLLAKAENLIEKSLKIREPESEVFFFKSIISFLCKDYIGSYENAKKAIEKADENIAMHYLNRSFSHICLKKYEEAIQDLTICIQLKEDIHEVYIYRAICAFLQDDLQLSIDDLNLVKDKFPNDSKILLKVAKLFSVIGYPEDSLLSLSIFKNPDPLLLAKNYLLLNDFPKAKSSLNLLPASAEQSTDLEITELLNTLKGDPDQIFEFSDLALRIQGRPGTIFTKKYSVWLAGVIFLYNNEYQSASNCFQTVLEILHEEEPEVFADNITIEEENCEVLYNLALCGFKSLKNDTKSNALMILEELSEVLNEKHKGQLLFLLALFQKNQKKAEKLMKEAVRLDKETLSPFLQNQEVRILPLHTSSDFSAIFPLIPLNFDQFPAVYVRPAVVLPHPCIEFTYEDLLGQLLEMLCIQNITPRPEAPWLLRVKGSIQFTDGFIQSNDLQTEEDNEKPEKKDFEVVMKSQRVFRQRSFLSERSLKKINDKEKLGLNVDRR